jgi:hypothetical protein
MRLSGDAVAGVHAVRMRPGRVFKKRMEHGRRDFGSWKPKWGPAVNGQLIEVAQEAE